MAIYDTSTILRCSKDRDQATCELVASDSECVIPPTVASEIRSSNLSIPSNCKVYTHSEEPFIANTEPVAFATAIEDVYLRGKMRRTKRRPWIPTKSERAMFARICTGFKNGVVDLNDWKILKEANILAEEGFVNDARLITDDKHLYLPFCIEQYENILEHMPEVAGSGYKSEALEIEVTPLKEALKEFNLATVRA